MKDDNLTFALDIGTRTVIGLLLKKKNQNYEIIASEVVEHDTRAMLDGQIHNVNQVAEKVKQVKKNLENKLDIELEKVSIAAAGRALKTVTRQHSIDHEKKKQITQEDVQQLEYAGVQAAQQELAGKAPEQDPGDYHFVGYSVIEYQLDEMFIKNLVGQKGREITAKIIATFLPRVVIDSLLSVIDQVGLEVEHLTLEPIAASQMVIPREMYNFNLALVDIGAGTADIAITKGGAMTGYAMVPVAGDEITEALAEKYMLDYNRAEKLKRKFTTEDRVTTKNILGSEIIIKRSEAIEAIKSEVKRLVKLIGEEIIRINQKSPQAVMCIGGGSLTPLLTEELTEILELDSNRIGIRDSNDLDIVKGEIKEIEGAQALTPIGIAVTASQSQSSTIFVNAEVNGINVQIFSLQQPTISDALLTAEVDLNKLKGKPGRGLTCTVNGELKSIKGEMGTQGKILHNGDKAQLEDEIKSGDVIEFEPGREGQDASALIAEVIPEKLTEKSIKINGTEVVVKPQIYQDGKLVKKDTPLKDGADIKYYIPDTIREAVGQIYEISPAKLNNQVIEYTLNGEKKYIGTEKYLIRKNGVLVDPDKPLKEGMELVIEENQTKSKKITDVVQNKGSQEIEITFNGSQLQVPGKRWEFTCNGEKITPDYEIQDGDKINYKLVGMTVNQVLDYINYNISESMKEQMELIINNQPAYFSDKIKDGDQIKINLSKKKSEGFKES